VFRKPETSAPETGVRNEPTAEPHDPHENAPETLPSRNPSAPALNQPPL
jgi:hypothetical protein